MASTSALPTWVLTFFSSSKNDVKTVTTFLKVEFFFFFFKLKQFYLFLFFCEDETDMNVERYTFPCAYFNLVQKKLVSFSNFQEIARSSAVYILPSSLQLCLLCCCQLWIAVDTWLVLLVSFIKLKLIFHLLFY